MTTTAGSFRNVIPLHAYAIPGAGGAMKKGVAMKNPVALALFDHWQALRKGRIAPAREEIDPRAIEDVLEHAFILQRAEAGPPRIRIAGMSLCDLLGMELRAMPATALFAPVARPDFLRVLEGMQKQPAIVELSLAALPESGQLPGQASGRAVETTAEMLLLPLAGSQGQIDRAIGCLVCNRTPPGPPVRFGITATRMRLIAGHNPARQPMQGFAEPAAPFCPPPAAGRGRQGGRGRRPNLRLVKSCD